MTPTKTKTATEKAKSKSNHPTAKTPPAAKKVAKPKKVAAAKRAPARKVKREHRASITGIIHAADPASDTTVCNRELLQYEVTKAPVTCVFCTRVLHRAEGNSKS